MKSDQAALSAYVSGASDLVGMFIDEERQPAVVAVMARLAMFASDLLSYDMCEAVFATFGNDEELSEKNGTAE